MAQSIYLTTTEPHCGKSLISLGIIESVLRRTRRVAVFRPYVGVDGRDRRDKNIDLLLTHFQLDVPYEDTYAFRASEVTDLLAQRRVDEVLNRIIEKYKALEARHDFILCIGSDLTTEAATFEFDFNAEVANTLASPVLLVGSGAKQSVEEIVSPIVLAVEAFSEKGCQLLGIIVNRADERRCDDIRSALLHELPEEIQAVSVIPANRMLASPTIKEVVEHLGAEVLYGGDLLDRQAYDYMVIAMMMEHYLARLRPNALLITPADRGAVILSALQAHLSANYPPLAGLLLTTGEGPAETVRRLLDGLPEVLPIIAVESETFETATRITEVRSYITPDNQAKIQTSLKLFNEYVDIKALGEALSRIEPRGIPPRMFLYNLLEWAKADKKRIVLPEGTDERILKATEYLVEHDVVDIILLGKPDEIHQAMSRLDLKCAPKRVTIIDPANAPQFDDYAQTLYELRKHRGMTLEHARDLMHDVSYFGTMMVYKGDADGMVSGAQHTTAHTITPAFQFIKTKPGFSVVSSVFFMCLEDRVLVYGDCAVVPRPTAEQLAEIAIASADTAKTFGIEPRVAMLSYSSGESGRGEEVERVRKATELAKQRRPDLLIEGPIQYDAAVDPDVARVKMPGSKVAGRATVLIFPDLNTGNNTYKAVQRETGAIAIGPVLQGLRKPVNDLSRGCTVDDVINTVAITAIQAQHT
ncbi:MAG: phosphate acetyltransferase [Chloroflexi bacterium]|nr:phosphate acetyltransferase [Chloroflexota bacterium]